jgi:hypothetical protein
MNKLAIGKSILKRNKNKILKYFFFIAQHGNEILHAHSAPKPLTKSHHFLSLNCNASRGLAMEWALTSSVNVTSTNTTNTNESAAALRLIRELNKRMMVS